MIFWMHVSPPNISMQDKKKYFFLKRTARLLECWIYVTEDYKILQQIYISYLLVSLAVSLGVTDQTSELSILGNPADLEKILLQRSGLQKTQSLTETSQAVRTKPERKANMDEVATRWKNNNFIWYLCVAFLSPMSSFSLFCGGIYIPFIFLYYSLAHILKLSIFM